MTDNGYKGGRFSPTCTALLGQLESPPPRLGPKWGKWADRLSDFVKYKGYLKNHTTSQTTYPTLSE